MADASFVRLLAAGLCALVLLSTFLAVRYVVLVRGRRRAMSQAWAAAKQGAVPDGLALPSAYFVYVLGSGGHTGELCEMIKQQFRPDPRSHRRYLITSGDQHSENAVARLEALIARTFPDGAGDGAGPSAGSWDVVPVVRARRVHQPLYTAWFSAILSAASVVQALLRPPVRPAPSGAERRRAADFQYPHLIVTNGPGTGFVVCLVAFVLRLLYVVPANRCNILFIETWAHVRTLSLTGKLFYYTRLADMLVVQHEPLAAKTGERYIGEVTKYGNLLGVKKALKRA